MRTHSMIQNYNFFWGVQPMSFSQHLKRLSAASPRHKGWAAARQLWALRCYPQALQLNFLYSVFIMQSQITENIEALFFMLCSQITNHSSQITVHKSNSCFSCNHTSYFPIMLSRLALPGPTNSKVMYAPKYKAGTSPSPKTSK